MELPHQRKQKSKHDEVEHAFIKEKGIVPAVRILDIDGKGKPLQRRIGNKPAVHFLIEEVAPAADSLCQDDARHEAVCDAQKVDLMDDAEKHDAERPAHDAADNGQTARTDTVILVERKPVLNWNAARDAIEQARTHDPDRQNTQ